MSEISDPVAPSAPSADSKILVEVEADLEPLIPKFMNHLKDYLATLHAAVAQDDLDTVKRTAHIMKGAGGYGFDAITEMAVTLERAAEAGERDRIKAEIAAVERYVARVEVVYV